jgi:hypothetical protein
MSDDIIAVVMAKMFIITVFLLGVVGFLQDFVL